MKRVTWLGCLLVVISGIIFCNTTIYKNGETLPPNPAGIVAFYK